jgi:hypothetical protein
VVAALGFLHQLLDHSVRQGDRQQAVLEAVVVEDAGEARRDDTAQAEVEERPRRMLAARSTAEIVAGDQHAGARILRLVQHEVRNGDAGLVKAHVVEQSLAQAFALHGLEELLGDNLVGIDIGDVQRSGLAVQADEGGHGRSGPENVEALVTGKNSVMGHQCQIGFQRLGDQKPVEGIVMMARQVL